MVVGQKHGTLTTIADHGVEVPVLIEVTHGQTAAHLWSRQGITWLTYLVDETPVPILEQQLGLSVG